MIKIVYPSTEEFRAGLASGTIASGADVNEWIGRNNLEDGDNVEKTHVLDRAGIFFEKFDPSQSRDDRGRFSSGGGVRSSLKELYSNSLGIARRDMPQVPNVYKPQFMSELNASGVKTSLETVDAKTLKPTQNEYNSSVIRSLREAIASGKFDDKNRVVVSSDGRVLDGHHRWAVAAQDGKELNVVRVDLPIKELLSRARDFNDRLGIEARKFIDPWEDVASAFDQAGLFWKFNPDQSRDERGRWGSGGSTGAKYDQAEVERRMAEAERVLSSTTPTDQISTPERDAFRQKVASEFYDKITAGAVQGRQATIVLGLPGAGKSTFIGPLEKGGAVNVDNDKIKEMIPEYKGGLGANAVHEEASGIARNVRNQVISEGYDLIWERIDSPDKIASDVRSLKAAGYDVHLKFVDVSPELATQSAIDRFMNHGRYVSPLVIQGYGDSPRESYELAKKAGVKSAERYAREPGKPLRQVE